MRTKGNRFEYVSWSKREFDLPKRSTAHSAGYDLHSPMAFSVKPNETVEISLEIKCDINEGEFLMLVPRSSMGWKGKHIAITNTVGIIDSDYYGNPNNEGEIRARFHNFGDEEVSFEKNDRLLQGIFVKYDVVEGDDATESRFGGLGSTGK